MQVYLVLNIKVSTVLIHMPVGYLEYFGRLLKDEPFYYLTCLKIISKE